MPSLRSFLARGSIAGPANRVKELYGRRSQANVSCSGPWHGVLRSMDVVPHHFFIDSGIGRKRLESVAGGGSALAPDRAFSILVVDCQTPGPIRDKQVKKPGRWISARRHRGVTTHYFMGHRTIILPIRRRILAVKHRSAGGDNGHCVLDGKEPVVALRRIRQWISAWPMSAGGQGRS